MNTKQKTTSISVSVVTHLRTFVFSCSRFCPFFLNSLSVNTPQLTAVVVMADCWKFSDAMQESSGAYNPQVEAISPTLPNDEARDVIKQSKDELLQSINRADREIGIVEQNLKKLQAKQVRMW